MTKREYPSAPLVGVGAIVVDPEGRVLLVKRGTEPRKGHWSIPGGLVELGETLQQAIQREIAEETGLAVDPIAIVEVLDRIFREEGAPVRYHYVLIDYLCRVTGGELRANSDAEEVRWVTRDHWHVANPLALEPIALAVLEKGWQMARQAGIHA